IVPQPMESKPSFNRVQQEEGEPGGGERRKLVEALEAMAFDYPEDVEVKVWVVLQAWENSYEGVPIGSREALDALLREVLAKQEWHPGAHHLRIHLWYEHDDRRALRPTCGTCPATPFPN
ncbi:MAG: hypothetical protein EBZ48_16815, partial [Proteobacteria bacterium]|nr:hypothetical protein [Pseudomonadota bacterium]